MTWLVAHALVRAASRLVSTLGGRFFQLLNELSDQNGYQRYLKMNGVAHSPEEWRRFTDGRYRRKYYQAKCC